MNKYIAVDCRLNESCCKFLENNGYTLIKIPCVSYLDDPVCAHPDMSLIKINKKLILYSDVKHLFEHCESKTALQREVSEKKKLAYPNDVGLNCAVVGNNLICNAKFAEKTVLDEAARTGMNIINVKQGYSKCSICVISENSIITEDAGIAESCNNNGIDVLLLKSRAVKLNGYNYGFIGGSCGTLRDGRIVFAGNIKEHPEYKEIRAFCAKYSKKPVSMSNEALYDVGSIIEL